MELPKSLTVKSLRPSKQKVFWFKSTGHVPKSPAHYHICLPAKDGKFIILIMSSSQIYKIESHYNSFSDADPNKEKLISSLVKVKHNEGISFIKKGEESIFDCNRPIFGTKEDIMSIVKDEIKIQECTISDDIYHKLIEAIRSSPAVKNDIKKQLLNDIE